MASLTFQEISKFEKRVSEGKVSLLEIALFAVRQGNVDEVYAATLSTIAVNILGVRKLAPDFMERNARNMIDDRLRLRILTISQIHDRFEGENAFVQFEITIAAAKLDYDFRWVIKFNRLDVVSVQVSSPMHNRYLWQDAAEIKKLFLRKV